MRYYEAVYIAHPNIEQDDLPKLIEETKASLQKRGGELLYEEIMGKKRLAYPIQKQRFGTYILLQFRGDGAGNARLNQDFDLNDNILAHMIVRIEEDEVREARVDASEEALAASEEPGMVDEVIESEDQDEEESTAPPESDTEELMSPEGEESPPSEEEELEPEVTEK
ncbi:MAG: 30S ribosomal protein S6 [Fidelibacterota bacterium]|nr:MAG: 30S ribosomal protein S6 [Candidatus Neomarinimicrobiota bacterium]